MFFKQYFYGLLYYIFCVCLILCPTQIFAASLLNQEAIDKYYLERDGQPLWVTRSGLNNDGQELYGVLQKAWVNGLNPENYHISQITDILDARSDDGNTTMLLELLLTDGYTQYVRDMSGMRVNARAIGLNPDDWNQSIGAAQALSFLDTHKDDIEDFMKKLEPQSVTYQKLQAELISMVNHLPELSAQDSAPFKFDTVLSPGRGSGDIPRLRTRLGIPQPQGETDYYVYDDALFQAIKDFQAEKGLKPDGLIGRDTVYALNQRTSDKIDQLIVNMERLRWAKAERPTRFIVVNIPSYTLWAVENGQVAFEMPVIVGRKKRQTLSFVTNIHGVRFNPTWTVPKTIKKEDILPHLQEDPNYLSDKGMELYDGFGSDAITLDPTSIDWNMVTKEELASFKMVQGSGANNPLGRIRVLMPNPHNIYLHDTNDRRLFAHTDRAQSSGCIRMDDPEKVASFILKTKSGWSDKKIQTLLDEGKMKDIYTNENMPVYLFYYTTWLGSDQQIIYGRDIYDFDKKLKQALIKIDKFPFMHNTAIVKASSEY